MTRTAEQQNAIYQIQEALGTDGLKLADEFADMLANTPADDLDREIDNLGHILMLALKTTAPHLSEAMMYGLPFAFAELIRERMRSPKSVKW